MEDTVLKPFETIKQISEYTYFEKIQLFWESGTYASIVQIGYVLLSIYLLSLIVDYQKKSFTKSRFLTKSTLLICILYISFSGMTKYLDTTLKKDILAFNSSTKFNEKVRILNSVDYIPKSERDAMYNDYLYFIQDNFKTEKIISADKLEGKNHYKISFKSPLENTKSQLHYEVYSDVITQYYADYKNNSKEKDLFFSYVVSNESIHNVISKGDILNYKIVLIYK